MVVDALNARRADTNYLPQERRRLHETLLERL
jgi:hypothetical protein